MLHWSSFLMHFFGIGKPLTYSIRGLFKRFLEKSLITLVYNKNVFNLQIHLSYVFWLALNEYDSQNCNLDLVSLTLSIIIYNYFYYTKYYLFIFIIYNSNKISVWKYLQYYNQCILLFNISYCFNISLLEIKLVQYQKLHAFLYIKY